MEKTFFSRKMQHAGQPELQYSWDGIPLNDLLGHSLRIEHTGNKQCVSCARVIKKTFQQGYCFPCSQSLARADICMVKPERCHFAAGTCREPEWGKEHCLIKHTIYLANTTGLKVGITRSYQQLTRWGDQGALQALPLAYVSERLHAGLVEQELAQFVDDKSNWRALITGKHAEVDLIAEAESLVHNLPGDLIEDAASEYREEDILHFQYPVKSYPEKASTWNLDKQPVAEGELTGIRGQYLFIGGKALNVRKYGGYELAFAAKAEG